jgi:dihydrofolate reductase
MFGGHGSWEEHPWDGWWGEDPPYHAPVFVLTHHAREPLEMQGGTTFYFVTEGIESALERAKEAAGEQDVALGGGADAAQQYLKAGLLDELTINIVPVLLGDGAWLFAGLGDADIDLECTRVIHGPGATHLSYRIVR